MMPRDLGETADPRGDLGPEWVWRRPTWGSSPSPIAVAAVPDEPGPSHPGLGSNPASMTSPGLVLANREGADGQDRPSEASIDVEQPFLLRMAALISIAVVMTGIVAWKGLGRNILGKLSRWAVRAERQGRNPHRPERTTSPGSRTRPIRDMPHGSGNRSAIVYNGLGRGLRYSHETG
jgi:hypothetical protein